MFPSSASRRYSLAKRISCTSVLWMEVASSGSKNPADSPMARQLPFHSFAHPPDLESDVLTRLDWVPKLGLDLQLCLFRSEILVAIDVTAAEPVLGWDLPHLARPLRPGKCVGWNFGIHIK